MFWGAGRMYAKGLMQKWGSRILETANNLSGWSPGGGHGWGSRVGRTEVWIKVCESCWGICSLSRWQWGVMDKFRARGWFTELQQVGLENHVFLRSIIFPKYGCHLHTIAPGTTGSRMQGLWSEEGIVFLFELSYNGQTKADTRARIHIQVAAKIRKK